MNYIKNKFFRKLREYRVSLATILEENINTTSFTAQRVLLGVYQQRNENTYMVRVRCTGGYITPKQFKGLYQILKTYDASHIHITTRQEIQIESVQLSTTADILDELCNLGLETYGSGGNSIRNIVASPDSGIGQDEAFDVLPHAISLKDCLVISEYDSLLPRKFKIAFSSSINDSVQAVFNDLGFVAQINKGKRGFKVFLGGSLGAKPMCGYELFDFIEEKEVLNISIAALKLFSRYGNRKNKHKARLRHIIYKYGKETVFSFFHKYYEEAKNNHKWSFLPSNEFEEKFGVYCEEEHLELATNNQTWSNYIKPQKQSCFYSLTIPIPIGNFHKEELLHFVEIIDKTGINNIRLGLGQDIILRNIPNHQIQVIYQMVCSCFPNILKAPLYNSILSCNGASVCRLGICNSPDLVKAIQAEIEKQKLCLNLGYNPVIRISGCPNSCGKHWIADLGFYGKVGNKNGSFPAYKIVYRAKRTTNAAKIAEIVNELPAKDIPLFIARFLNYYNLEADKFSNFQCFLHKEGKSLINQICNHLNQGYGKSLPKGHYIDWGSDRQFSVNEQLKGQCSAGLFDMIEQDIAIMRQKKKQVLSSSNTASNTESLQTLLLSTCHMLLVTRGSSPQTTEDIYRDFEKHFIQTGLIDNKHSNTINNAQKDNQAELNELQEDIIDLTNSVLNLYDTMDDSLQFNQLENSINFNDENPHSINFKDYRGVACPMNFVKIKIDLMTLAKGDILTVWLDEGEPIKNVPESLKQEGHQVLLKVMTEDHWEVKIQKC